MFAATFLTSLRQESVDFINKFYEIEPRIHYRGIFHQNRKMVSKAKSPTSEFTNLEYHQLRGMTVLKFLLTFF